jgi:hypothetical protein
MMKLVSSADDGAAHAQRTTSSSTTVTVLNDDSLHAGDELNLVQGTVGSSTDFRFTLRNADGKSALVELNAALSYGPDGFQCRFIGVAFEV